MQWNRESKNDVSSSTSKRRLSTTPRWCLHVRCQCGYKSYTILSTEMTSRCTVRSGNDQIDLIESLQTGGRKSLLFIFGPSPVSIRLTKVSMIFDEFRLIYRRNWTLCERKDTHCEGPHLTLFSWRNVRPSIVIKIAHPLTHRYSSLILPFSIMLWCFPHAWKLLSTSRFESLLKYTHLPNGLWVRRLASFFLSRFVFFVGYFLVRGWETFLITLCFRFWVSGALLGAVNDC